VKAPNPPRFGVWLLEHFGPETNLEALTGDLLEGLSQGKSRAWYWRQILTAIAWRKHLRELIRSAFLGLLILLPLNSWESSRVVSRPLDIAIFTIAWFVMSYLPGMLRRKLRLVLVALTIVFFGWLYLYHHNFYHHYAYVGVIAVIQLLIDLKKTKPWRRSLTGRALIKNGPDADRARMIETLHLDMLRETDPELRQEYAQAINDLRSEKSRGTMPPQPGGPSLA
jgi:hypothetical protein